MAPGQRRGGEGVLNSIRRRIEAGERIGANDASYLMTRANLLDLAPLAQLCRLRHNPAPEVTFVIDTNLNYTNVCGTRCSFCAFHRADANDPGAYTHTVPEMMEKVSVAAERGCTTVIMQGGLHPTLPLSYYQEMISETVRRHPALTPHYYSPPEIVNMSRVSGRSVLDVLRTLKDAGQRTLPGGGAEILSDRVKRQISGAPPKGEVQPWIEVNVEAHRLGLNTTATMMYGHVETDEDIVESLRHIRRIQDRAADQPGGFTAFIPWSFKRENTALGRIVEHEAGANRYLRMIAVSRIFLDNVPHIQASWFSEGDRTGQIALHFGADDFGGTLFDETVMLSAGFYNRTTVEEIKALIRDAGFAPVRRTTEYETVERFAGDETGHQRATEAEKEADE